MKIIFLMNIGGVVNAKVGEIRRVDEETGRALIGYMVAEEYFPPPRQPKYKPIIVHTRCFSEQK